MIHYDPLGAVLEWLGSLAGILTDPASPFWWPTLIAVLVGMGIVAATTGASWREVRREALAGDPQRFLRQLPSDLVFMLANSALPFLAAPVFLLIGALGVFFGMRLLAPLFGLPPDGSVLDDPAKMVLCALVAFVAGDFALYWSHRVFHRVPVLWRAHQLHHAPRTLNPFTAFRFWPHEQMVHLAGTAFLANFAMGMMAAILGTGITVYTLLGVNVFALVWNLGFAHLRHSHIALHFPRWMSHVLVSPVMHQVHHSADVAHHDRNFATVFALWDWMFGTLYLPERGERFRFGLDAVEEAAAEAKPEAARPVG